MARICQIVATIRAVKMQAVLECMAVVAALLILTHFFMDLLK